MKSKAGILLFLGISIILFSHLANSQGDEAIPGEISGITNTSDKIAGIVSNPSEENTSALLKEWKEMFLGNPGGKVLVKIWDFLKKPLTFVIGTPAEISWKFAIAVLLWIGMLLLISNVVEFLPFSKTTSWILGLCFVTALSILGLINKVAVLIDNLAGKWWGKIIIFLLLISLIIISPMIGKEAAKQKKEQDKLKEELEREKINNKAKIVETYADAMTK